MHTCAFLFYLSVQLCTYVYTCMLCNIIGNLVLTEVLVAVLQDADTLQQYYWWTNSLCCILPLCGISWSQFSGVFNGETNTCVVRLWK